ncbi:MAG: Minus agglutinin [Candidatus Daviesbacteria bacterium GW2011_GWB1_41_5]|uniref:Minus agglutinin n=1 Tax=Candidatus Daviesbacteria bacterium GW2011_GWB1_41_5 TaxID=1618429 RepID=A0A0G0WMK6_9BACT|nr:MAG: Minus agglutinin [Candidatus Daviesbacteria bacterium GW2011_GWB1_41_5]
MDPNNTKTFPPADDPSSPALIPPEPVVSAEPISVQPEVPVVPAPGPVLPTTPAPLPEIPVMPQAGFPSAENPVPTWPPQPPAAEPEGAIPPFGQPLSEPPAPPFIPPLTMAEAGPTDLSHLVGNIPTASVQPEVTQPETLVTPSGNEANQVVGGGGNGFPKWLLFAGGFVLLLVVAGASAYFILGFGQQEIPPVQPGAEQTPPTVSTQVIPPTLPPQPTVPASTSSGSFGGVSGEPTASPSGTSALDLLRQRQGQ